MPPPPLPLFSLVIPTYNRPGPLAKCLESLAELDYPRDRFEVIVVDDGSQMPLESLVASVRDRLDVRYIRQTNAGPAAARNRGAAEARGDWVAFTDDDCLPHRDWLLSLAKASASVPDGGLGGRTINGLRDNSYSATSQVLLDYLYGYFNKHGTRPTFFASNNLAFSISAFRACGAFDLSYPRAAAEDRELCDRWVAQGRPLAYAPEALVTHAHDLTLRSLWRQHRQYGEGAYLFHHMRRSQHRQPIPIEPLPFYVNMLRFPFSCLPWWQAIKVVPLTILTQLANAYGYFVARARDPLRSEGRQARATPLKRS